MQVYLGIATARRTERGSMATGPTTRCAWITLTRCQQSPLHSSQLMRSVSLLCILTRMPGGVTEGDSGLCCCVPCLSSAVISLCFSIFDNLNLIFVKICLGFFPFHANIFSPLCFGGGRGESFDESFPTCALFCFVF